MADLRRGGELGGLRRRGGGGVRRGRGVGAKWGTIGVTATTDIAARLVQVRPGTATGRPGGSIASATPGSELVQRLPVGDDSPLHLGEGRSYGVIVLLGERRGQVLPEPVEMLADDPADLLVARGPVPAGRWRPAGRARHVRQRRHPEGLVLVREQPGPGPQVGEELVK